MITSAKTQKLRDPTWGLAEVQQRLKEGRYLFSFSAQRDYQNMGMSRKQAVACIDLLCGANFHCCFKYVDGCVHDCYKASPYDWYDENEECERSDVIFIKLYVDDEKRLVIERFHLDGGRL